MLLIPGFAQPVQLILMKFGLALLLIFVRFGFTLPVWLVYIQLVFVQLVPV